MSEEHVLLHELEHVARYDDWTKLAARPEKQPWACIPSLPSFSPASKQNANMPVTIGWSPQLAMLAPTRLP